jgi:HPt (histidine-containing phosphotransfer) domain-containing protein
MTDGVDLKIQLESTKVVSSSIVATTTRLANASQESDDADRTCDIRSQVLSMPKNPAADPIDWPVAMEAALDDVELLRSVAAAAFQEVSEHVRNLHTALDEGDAKLAQRSCHTVKNLLRTFGCTEPMQFTEQIELSAKAGELDGLKPKAELLEQLVEPFVEQLGRFVRRELEPPQPEPPQP